MRPPWWSGSGMPRCSRRPVDEVHEVGIHFFLLQEAVMAIATDIRRTDLANRVAGKHVTYFEEPDIIYMKFNGEVSAEEGIELLRRQLQFAEGRSRVFFLIDGELLEKIAPEARK